MLSISPYDPAHPIVEICPLPPAGLVATEAASSSAEAVYPLNQTFLLHSLPSATKVIYLDFNGHTTTGTPWNSQFTGGQPIISPVYSQDNLPAFSDTELLAIQEIFDRVSEDFAPFDVDVTTEDPGVPALVNSGGTDNEWGVRVVIGGAFADWLGSSAGGIAFVGSFSWDTDTPAFVFEEDVLNGFPKYAAEATTHEVGHTLGLSHDGTSALGYYEGHGDGATGWAPIMGAAYYQELSQWSKGEYADANNQEDDLNIITTQNGFGFRPDDHANTTAGATPMSVNGLTATGSGFIGTGNDSDFFSFTVSTEETQIALSPAGLGANVDVSMTLWDSSGTLVDTSNPLDGLDGSFDTTLSPGTYYVGIDGVGAGQVSDTGYSDYGSLGAYSILVTQITTLPVLSIDSISATEGNTGTKSFTFTVTLSEPLDAPVTVQFATSDVTATAPSDYQASSGTLTFEPGVTTQTVTVTVVSDRVIEPDETFNVTLSSPSTNALIDFAQGVGLILNEDQIFTGPMPNIRINDVSRNEGDSGTSLVTFTVTLSEVSGNEVSIAYATADGSATAASDYIAASGVIAFEPGTTVQTVSISVIGDLVLERDEFFVLNLFDPVAGILEDAQGIATIVNDDLPPPRLYVGDVTITETAAGDLFAVFSVALSGGIRTPVSVSYATANGTAAAGTDYTPQADVLTFTSGNTTQQVFIPILDDAEFEPNETFFLNLSSPTVALMGDGQGIATIIDEEGGPLAEIMDSGDAGYTIHGQWTTAVNLLAYQLDYVYSEPGTGRDRADWRFSDLEPGDYEVFARWVPFSNRATNAPFTVSDGATTEAVLRVNQRIAPNDEYSDAFYWESLGNFNIASGELLVSLSDAANGLVTADAVRIVKASTITQEPEIDVSSGGVSIAAGDTTPSTADGTDFGAAFLGVESVTKSFVIRNSGNAALLLGSPRVEVLGANPGDFTVITQPAASVAPGGLTTFDMLFSPTALGSRTATIRITSGDANEDPFEFAISGNSTNTLPPVAFVPSQVSVSTQGRVVEGDAGTTAASFTISLNVPSAVPVTVHYVTSGGTATAKADYLPQKGTLTFLPGVMRQTVTVPIVGDRARENDEFVAMQLSNISGGTIATNMAMSTIVDTDAGWQNPIDPNDVNADGHVSPLDALIVINRLNSDGVLTLSTMQSPAVTDYYDVDGDGALTPLDALMVVNRLNRGDFTAAASSEAQTASVVARAVATPLAEPIAVSVVSAEPAVAAATLVQLGGNTGAEADDFRRAPDGPLALDVVPQSVTRLPSTSVAPRWAATELAQRSVRATAPQVQMVAAEVELEDLFELLAQDQVR